MSKEGSIFRRKGGYLDPPDLSTRHQLQFYCDKWLHTRKPNVKEATYIKYSTVVEKYIKPQFGCYFPAEITSGQMENFTDVLIYEDKLSTRTIRDILTILKGILKYTAAFFPEISQVCEISYPKCVKKEMRVLSPEEQQRLIDCLMTDIDNCKFGILLALLTGLRIGEVCALRWNCISLPEKTLRIIATLQRLRNIDGVGSPRTRLVTGTPKSDTSARTIPLTDHVAELCRKMRPVSENAYVLTGTEVCMEPRTLQYRMEKYTKACGLEGVHFHTLRHTFATRAVEAGFEIKSLSEILGHSSTTITLDRYVHSSLELKRNEMKKLTSIGF